VTNVFFYIVDQKLEVKYHWYLTGSLFKSKRESADIRFALKLYISCDSKNG